MQRLSHRDNQAVLGCLRTVYATLDVETFPRQVIAALRCVVNAPFGSYNQIDPRAARIRYVVEPAGALVSGLELSSRQYMHEQPALAHYVRTGDGSPRKLSDFLSRSEFHRLGIYTENYCRTGVEYQMTFMLHDRRPPVTATIAIALDRSRGGSDFSERDRLALSLLRPHLATAHANAVMVSAMRRRGSALAEGPDTHRYETIVLTRGARRALSERTRRWLVEYFDDRPSRGDRLPDTLQRWVRRQVACLEDPNPIPPPVIPLIVEREQRRLSIRLIPNSPDNVLILEEEQTMADDLALQRHGLTPREAQVLRWLGEGKTNPEIGIILGARDRTIAKHVQRIYTKLGVETRAAAARFALACAPGAHQ